MRAKQLKQVLTTAWLVSGFVVSSYRSFCLQKPGHRHGLGRLAAPNKDPQGIKPVEENEPRVLFSRDDLQKLTNVQLKEILRALGLKVSGRKADLVERLVDHKAEIQGVRSGKREIPKAEEPAILETDVFIALDKTVQKLETLLQEERVVFLRAGVASGKSTLAQYLCREQPSKYLQVCPPAPGKETDAECWYKALLQAVSPADVDRDLQIAFELLSKNEQVLVFDECHLLFACPAFYQQFLKTPPYLTQRPMVLLLSAASELQSVERPTFTTPCEISGKYMWTPPIPHAKALVNQLAQADVHLSEAAVEFFLSFSGGHRGIFMRAMEWVQKKQEGTGKKWTVARAYGEVKLAWAGGDWIDQESFLGTLATGTNSIRVNGHGDLAMPQKFLEILCGGATRDLDSEDRRNLAIHGLLLPVAESRRDEEFVPYDWSLVGANYGVSNHLLASYYRYVLEKKRELEVEVNMNSSSGIDLLLRALPYLHFSTVVGSVILQNNEVQATFSARGHLAEVHYTGAIIQILERLGFSAKSVETGTEGNVDVYCTTQDDSTFAIEAVMAAREPADIEEHRNRFDQVTNYYADAKHKCLLIIGRKDSKLRQLVQGTRGGIEIVGLAANSAHTGYHVYVKQLEQQGEEVLDFYIPCDGVARSFAFKDEEPFFEISSAQKFKSIQPGTPSPTQTKAVWVRQLQKDGEKVELVGNAFQVLGELANVDHLKKAIEKEEKLSIAPSKIDIFSQQQDGKWIREEKMSESLRDTSKTDCYGFTIPST